jgi:predicted transcriptional regulator
LPNIEIIAIRGLHTLMAKAKYSELRNPPLLFEGEDEATLAAIDEGLDDAKKGKTVSIEKVRKLLPQWIPASFSRKGR